MSFRLPKSTMITIFHDPTCKLSKESLRLLKRAAITHKFDVDVVQSKKIPPTHAQVADIIRYLGNGSEAKGASLILKEDAPKVSTIKEAQLALDGKPGLLKKPLIVDWDNRFAIVADPPSLVQTFVDHIKDRR
ncbi:hypothetical protein BX616_002972 [Lobosporangium transversale]|uniref:Thioredoxin-like protein n=1 Tax=Lobosporangium transversale TaxID=64571 RepID=A0A1Y2GS65_9FUNG|nr:hypothetical protein BCR41DRAFT_421568 [Lobosporangium transversale]KAF9899522.1 hypothetical protein BX616_002972 [Lobosporangium transversale]ORZ18325.1 hypothetical protein BCR41DRAFT_421568 [Lobosporangium transversale]|eukprot:XP_021882120.1 hypothetical protein BCR41DRAFT_421568 [Lobosporangium transversale]